MSRIKVVPAALATLAAITACAIPSSASAEANGPNTTEPGTNAEIDIEIINGSGCPAGTADVSMNSDNSSFTVTYSDYRAAAGEGVPATEFRKNCQLTLRVNAPSDHSYAIERVDYSGFAHLDDGAAGLMQAAYYFQGSPDTSYSPHEFQSPYNDNWQISDSRPVSWSECGEQPLLNINTELRVQAPENGSTSLMTMDTTRGSARSVYHLAWKSC